MSPGARDRIRTLAFGVIVDPNISQPLPFAGLSYVDFNLFGTGTQFSGFFGGSYGQLAFSAPSLRGTRWQLAGRAFGIASSYNDRAFEQRPRAVHARHPAAAGPGGGVAAAPAVGAHRAAPRVRLGLHEVRRGAR